jgi:hypothetical protein
LEESSGEEHFGLLFGLRAEDIVAGYGDWSKRLRSSGIDPREIAQRQLGYLNLPSGELPEVYVNFAFRLPLSGFPLLAHRFMYLTTELAASAADVDSSAAHRAVLAFFRTEAAWVMAAGPRYEEAMSAYLEDRDRPAILDAYRRLCEGVFRPYASLLCTLAEIKLGTAASVALVVEPTLGAIEQRLQRVAVEPACRLLASFLRGDLRNADAHARAAVGGSGELIVRLTDGRHEAVVPNHVWATTQSLRSALDGVDSAINVFFATNAVYAATPDDFPSFMSEQMVQELARRAAHDFTNGTISSLRIDRGRLSATFVGEATEAQLNLMLRSLAVAAGNQFEELAAVSADGRLLYRLTRNDP